MTGLLIQFLKRYLQFQSGVLSILDIARYERNHMRNLRRPAFILLLFTAFGPALGVLARADSAPSGDNAPAPSRYLGYLGAGYGVGVHNQSVQPTGFTLEGGLNLAPEFMLGLSSESSLNPFAAFSSGATTDLDVFTVEAFYSPEGGTGFFIGVKGGAELAIYRDDNNNTSSDIGWVIGPSAGYEIKIDRHVTLGLEGEYFVALTGTQVPNLALFQGFFRARF